MSSNTSTCPGCDKTFSVRGYESHLTQSQDPLCQAVYEELRMAHTLFEHLQRLHGLDSDTESQGDAQEIDMPAEHPPTNVEDDEPPQSDSDESEEEDGDAQAVEFEPTWEPPREGAPTEGIEEEVDDDSDYDDQEDSDIGARRAAERVIIGEGHGVKPGVVLRYTDKYPSSAAGGILARGDTGDKNYLAAVSGQDKTAWAPFKSRQDWEVALWAKLRGPGSTAFSDLLAIPGVRFNPSLT